MDWDGTTALSRAGWAPLMLDIYLEHLPATPEENDAARRACAWEELMRLNGRPSIHQMHRLVELVRERGGTPSLASDYQATFQDRLAQIVERRLEQVRRGDRAAHTLLVPGVIELFEGLQRRGIQLTLASGTPRPQLMAEAELLGVAHYFDGRLYGPADLHDAEFSKRGVIAKLVANGLDGASLMAFGDGPVELMETKAVGGIAIAVACDEHAPGKLDEWKREMLLLAGADAVVSDYSGAEEILLELVD